MLGRVFIVLVYKHSNRGCEAGDGGDFVDDLGAGPRALGSGVQARKPWGARPRAARRCKGPTRPHRAHGIAGPAYRGAPVAQIRLGSKQQGLSGPGRQPARPVRLRQRLTPGRGPCMRMCLACGKTWGQRRPLCSIPCTTPSAHTRNWSALKPLRECWHVQKFHKLMAEWQQLKQWLDDTPHFHDP